MISFGFDAKNEGMILTENCAASTASCRQKRLDPALTE
jgi:hypothetical protein